MTGLWPASASVGDLMKVKPGDAQLSSASELGNRQSTLFLIVRYVLDQCIEWPYKMFQDFKNPYPANDKLLYSFACPRSMVRKSLVLRQAIDKYRAAREISSELKLSHYTMHIHVLLIITPQKVNNMPQ